MTPGVPRHQRAIIKLESKHFRTVLFGGMAMVLLAVVVVPRLTDDEVTASWVIIGVGIVAVGQLVGYLVASLLSRYESRGEGRRLER